MTVIICPLDAAVEACAAHAATHIISLLAPPAEAPLFAVPAARLRLSFNDIVTPADGLVAPNVQHIEQLLEFLDGWDRASPLLIHCWAGVSRSTAAGYIAATLRDGPGSEAPLAARLRQRAPFATPNSLMVALADQALGRQGAMTAAIAGIGRGAETSQGALFRL
jgi:predicted protein tyrosine phosphatase